MTEVVVFLTSCAPPSSVSVEEPHLLCLDERYVLSSVLFQGTLRLTNNNDNILTQHICLYFSTNHVDLETLQSMSKALHSFEGSVLMVSHNQGFLAGFCNELWVLGDGKLTVKHSTESSFDEIFSEYKSSILQSADVSMRRQQKAGMAKRASKQTAGRQYGVLM